MPITVQCPNPSCGVTSTAAESVSGRNVKCKKCGRAFVARPTIDGQLSDTRRSRPIAAADPFPTLPAEFGRYRVLRLLGRGGMGSVYLAHDTHLGREVALKLPSFDAAESPVRADRFVREARSAAVLQHPNICTVFDAGQIDGRPYITMAYIAGRPLEDRIDPDRPMPQAEAAGVIRTLAAALGHAHEKGIVHRDLKPANVMISADNGPVVMDFGLAKRFAETDAAEAKLTRDGALLGTPSYMAPEQVAGTPDKIGPPTDVYALGVMLYELLTGRTPYTGPLAVVLGQIMTAPIPAAEDARPDVDPRLDAVCRKAMAKDPAARYASMAAFAAALDACLTAPTAAASPADPLLFAVSDPPPAVRTTTRPVAPRRPRWPVMVGAGFAGAVVLLAVVLFTVRTKHGDVVVELSDPAANVAVKVDGETIGIAGIDKPLTLTAGEHGLTVVGAEFETVTQSFAVKSGGKQVVKVSLRRRPDAPPKPTAAAPPSQVVDRKPSYLTGGDWRVEGEHLVQAKPGKAVILFGNPDWTDYDIALETRTDLTPGVAGRQGCGVCFRAADRGNHYCFGLGAYGGTWNEFTRIENGKWNRDVEPLKMNYDVDQWHKVEVRVRGSRFRCSLDGQELFDHADQTFPAGLIGLTTWDSAVRWRNIRVTSPTGKVLFDGLPDVPAAAPDLGAAHPDRTAAEYVLSVGGTVRANDESRDITRATDLPREPFNLSAILLRGNRRVTDAGLAACAGIQNLKHLDLVDTPVTSGGLEFFKNCTGITVLDLVGAPVGDYGITHFKDCKNIVSLWLGGTRVTDQGLAALSDCRNVFHLDLSRTGATDAGLAHFKGCKGLGYVNLWGTKVSDVGLAQLKGCKQLADVTLQKTLVTADGIGELKSALPKCKIAWDGTPP